MSPSNRTFLVHAVVLLVMSCSTNLSYGVCLQTKPAEENKPTSVDFGGEVLAIAPSLDGLGAFVIREGEQGNELVFWDSETNVTSDAIQVPKTPQHLHSFDKALVVTCPDSGVIVLIDPATKKITNALPTDDFGRPSFVCMSEDNEKTYFMTTKTANYGQSSTVIEVDWENRTGREVWNGDFERATVQGTKLVCQDNFGGSPSGKPKVFDVEDAVDNRRRDFPHATFGLIYPSQNGLFVASHEGKTIGFPPIDNLNKIEWSQEGTLMAPWANQTRFLLTKGDDMNNTKKFPLIAVSQTGSILWKKEIPIPNQISMFLTKMIFAKNYREKFLVGTANHGLSGDVAKQIVQKAINEAYVIGTGSNDHLLFCVATYDFRLQSRFGIMITPTTRKWYSTALPSSQSELEKTVDLEGLPKEIKAGDELAYSPKFPEPHGKYILKQGPDGMTVDSKTGKIQWPTTISSLGKWDVEIVDQLDESAETVLKFEINVKL